MAYRNDEAAVEARRLEIERELTDVRLRADRFEYLKWREKELAAELAAVTKTKESLARARLPMLANAKIASPCSADWDRMKGDERVRFCDGCQKNVYNLSALTSTDAEALIREKEGDLCARMYLRGDDTVITTDCPVGVRRKWISRVAGAVVALGGAAAAVLGYRLQPAPIPVAVAEPQPVAQPLAAANPGMLGAPDPNATLLPLAPPPSPPDPNSSQKRTNKGGNPPRHLMGMMRAPTSRNRE